MGDHTNRVGQPNANQNNCRLNSGQDAGDEMQETGVLLVQPMDTIKTMTLEELYDKLGGFGKFQILLIASVYSMVSMTGWSMMQMAYAGLIPDFHCMATTSHDSSQNESTRNHLANDTRNICMINTTTCKEYVFEGSSRTVITEWNLVCDMKWIKATIISIQMGGVLLGAVLAGQCGDYFGRKKTIFGAYLVHALLNIAAAFSISWEMFTAMRALIGICIGFNLVMKYPYIMEFMPTKWRAAVPAIPSWPLGICLFAGAAYVLDDWSHLHLACAVISAPGLLTYFVLPDSVRWLTVKNRVDEAVTVIDRIAKLNGTQLPSCTKDVLEQIAREEKESRPTGRTYSYVDLLREKRTIINTLCFAFIWASLSLVFYGLGFGVSSFSGNIYLNIFLMSIIEIPVGIANFFIVNKVGRRWSSFIYFGVGSVAAFGCLVAKMRSPEDQMGAMISGLSHLAKQACNSAWFVSGLWVIESYPTVTRSLAFATANTAARIGGIIAPFAINFDNSAIFSYTLMGSLFFICLLLIFIIPETNGQALADSFQRGSTPVLRMTCDLGKDMEYQCQGHESDITSNNSNHKEIGQNKVEGQIIGNGDVKMLSLETTGTQNKTWDEIKEDQDHGTKADIPYVEIKNTLVHSGVTDTNVDIGK